MELQLHTQTESRLQELSIRTGRPVGDLVDDALVGYFEELADMSDMLDSRYDDIKTGRIAAIDGNEAFARLRRK